MFVILSFTLVPVNAGVSLSPFVAACQKILKESGLNYQLHANGTNVEGEWDVVFKTIKRCHKKVHQMGADRIFTTIQLGTRTDKSQKMIDKEKSVMDILI